jgi:serine/threonine protein kinase
MLESVHARLFGEELEPTVVGAHQIVKRLGTGGMGEVYLALNTEFERLEALKVVRSGRAREPRDRQRLVDEGKALAQLAHPNVVHVYGGKIADGNNFYLAMEYAPGQTVEAWQRGEPRPWREVLGVYVAAGEGLRAVHQAGLIHRDFKPSNIILGAEKDGPAPRPYHRLRARHPRRPRRRRRRRRRGYLRHSFLPVARAVPRRARHRPQRSIQLLHGPLRRALSATPLLSRSSAHRRPAASRPTRATPSRRPIRPP